MKDKELEIEWIPEPEEFIPPPVDNESKIDYYNNTDLPAFIIDKMCKRSFGHTNWARMSTLDVKDLVMNPAVIDYDEGIVYFKHERLV